MSIHDGFNRCDLMHFDDSGSHDFGGVEELVGRLFTWIGFRGANDGPEEIVLCCSAGRVSVRRLDG